MYRVFALMAIVFVTIFFSVITIAVSLFDETGNLSHCVARIWARVVLVISGVKVHVEGIENVDLNSAYIYMANHQSMYDIPAILGYLPVQFRWLAKIELFRIPAFGQAMLKAGYIPIDRSNRKAAFKSLKKAGRKVREGRSVLVFPEGSRSSHGDLKPFKKGGFLLALKSGRSVVPVSISGSGAILPKGRLLIHPGRIIVGLHSPLETAGLTNKTMDGLMHAVRSVISSDLELYNRKDGNDG